MSLPTMDQILAEQQRCAEYITEKQGPDTDGAWRGLGDWVAEECLELDRRRRDYARFLESKRVAAPESGFEVADSDINPMLFPFQRDVVRWALRRGKAGNFMHTGLGKGPIQLEWLRHVQRRSDRPVFLLAPLAVSQQFCIEAQKFHIDITPCRVDGDVRPGINVANYERLERFDIDRFAGVALDESSCIKDRTSKTTATLIDRLAKIPYKLCSTATPAPNDHAELGTHAELLDVMKRSEMLAMYFEHDGGETSKWALKGHGRKPFFRFVSTWGVCVNRPSDLGYEDAGFDLPKLNLFEHVVAVDQLQATDGMLFRCPDLSATGLHKEMRLTCEARARRVAELVAQKPQVPWLLWCNTNYEADALKAVVPDVVEVRGSDDPDKKEAALIGFAQGKINRLLSKPEIAGFGMNYQHCCNMAFVGLSYSFEQLFQAIRRCWRYGQNKPVNAHLVVAETEGAVLESIRRKEKQYEELQAEMNAAMREEQLKARGKSKVYEHSNSVEIPAWLQSQE